MSQQAIRIIVVDDHPLFRAGVVAMLAAEPDILIVGQAGTGADGIEAYRSMRPDVAVVDLKLPDMDGDEVVGAIRKIEPMARVIVLTTFGGDAAARRTLAAGAQGYLLKTSLANDLVGVVRAVHAGQHRVSAEVAKRLFEYRGDEPLTERELSVLRGVAAGLENKQIARHLGIAADTVKEHLSHAMAKLRATNRAHALSIALARGYLA
ncbi:response regulator transcription factor [Luteibacter aegosomatis]|uniref:response regulator n=1 Tax=Luteibacter aegosomatis TaxID=2911537 RepID=UPI001FF90BC1|nr:response regulator transcription factor [Luteibacter aegosomatis]UPG83932.1 response regulator transcription factor [Luteibacter aegosomatis]